MEPTRKPGGEVAASERALSIAPSRTAGMASLAGALGNAAFASIARAPRVLTGPEGDEDLEKFLDEQGIELSPLAQALLRADRGRLEQLLREAAQRGQLGDIQHGFQEGKFTHAMAQALGLGALTGEMEGLKGSLGGLDPETGKRFGAFLDRRLQDLADMLKSAVRQELDRQDVDRRDRQGMQALAEKSFFYLTEDEMRLTADIAPDAGMKWIKRGRLLDEAGRHPWQVSHAAVPIADPVDDHTWRLFFSTRDAGNR